MSSQHESKQFTISRSNVVHSNTVQLVHRLTLVDNPLDDIPLLPGESIHIGYTPMTEEQAFETKRELLVLPHLILSVSHFRIARDDVDIDELVKMIHRFIAINDTVERLVPKRQYINMDPGKRLYEAKVTHSWRNHHATIQVSIIALPANRSEEFDEYAVNVNRLCGSVTAHRMFFHTLEQYVKSCGHSYPIILPVSVDREALATKSLLKQETWQWNEHLPLDKPEDMYNREESDEEPYQGYPFRDVIASKTTPGQYSSDEESI